MTRTLKTFATLAIAAFAASTAQADPFLFGNTNTHEVVSLITDHGTLLTSTSPFNAGFNNSGWWSATDTNATKGARDNYLAGTFGVDLLNDFFTFAVPLDTGAFTSVTISIPRGDAGLTTTTGVPFTFALHDVSTSASTLNTTTGTSAAIFNDLGSGNLYGSVLVTSTTSPDPLTITLDAAALADLNAARGGFFSLGGTLTPTAPVPEPGSLILLAIPALALAFRIRRKA